MENVDLRWDVLHALDPMAAAALMHVHGTKELLPAPIEVAVAGEHHRPCWVFPAWGESVEFSMHHALQSTRKPIGLSEKLMHWQASHYKDSVSGQGTCCLKHGDCPHSLHEHTADYESRASLSPQLIALTTCYYRADMLHMQASLPACLVGT